ncbi:unnamed protein product, partial [Musa acuminata var. zebrina]
LRAFLNRWLENICDWCISRQLWWGHRVPAWYVTLEKDQFKDMDCTRSRRVRYMVFSCSFTIICAWLARSHTRFQGILPNLVA